MAAVSSIFAVFRLGFRRSHVRPPGSLAILDLQPRAHPTFRILNGIQPFPKERLLVLHASNSNGSNRTVPGKGKADNRESSSADGPPLLTILAGLVVFLTLCWAVGSIIMWLVSLIVNVPPSYII